MSMAKQGAVRLPEVLHFSRLPDSLRHSEIPGEITPVSLVGTCPMTPVDLEWIRLPDGPGIRGVTHALPMIAYSIRRIDRSP